MAAENVETLRPKLAQAQKALEAAMDEACETDIAEADDAELIRLEESLTVARDAARNAISVLQRLQQKEQEGDGEETEPEAHRLFVDDRGVQWDVFPVIPSRATSGRRSTLPDQYHQGWLSMQSKDEIRRVTPIPEEWSALPREALCQLLDKASASPRRTPARGVPKSTQPSSPTL